MSTSFVICILSNAESLSCYCYLFAYLTMSQFLTLFTLVNLYRSINVSPSPYYIHSLLNSPHHHLYLQSCTSPFVMSLPPLTLITQEEEQSQPRTGDSSDEEEDGEKNNKYDKAGKLRKMKHEQQVCVCVCVCVCVALCRSTSLL